MRLLGVLLILFVSTVHAGSARAGGFEVSDQGASAGGTANAAVARADDTAAAWHNPAWLADGAGFRLMAGATFLAPTLRGEATDQTWIAETNGGVSVAPYAYLSVAVDDFLGGVSVNVPFASNIRWPANWDQRFDILESKPQVFRVAPFLGWNFGRIRIAAGPHFDF
ncbi:MAG: outer membrane protein transport protein, partial [Myxococcales bacterium]|nr:outer membrane protein transport protein [Myxococcales bacterium]